MQLKLVCVGKLKRDLFQNAAAHYQKMLGRFAPLELIEVPDSPAPEKYSGAQRAQIVQREGERILSRITGREHVIALCIDGHSLTSPALAETMDAWMRQGKSALTFVIGGSLGLSDDVVRRADDKLSLSNMTLPHQLARIVLLEQIYRAFTILRGQTYHK
ncbi:MAG: 23S rRNA (pseudouridine(1915)-N(3))-methyltransferase RlmH [Christensenellales bacterium]|jgi:23S rRNA (pseudouridine1915-N3)-methyltransferase